MNITVGELKKQLDVFDDDAELYFGGLDFNRLKSRGDKLVQMEFEQNVSKDDSGVVHIDNL